MPPPHPRPWHRGSIYGDGPRRPLDRNGRARFRYLLRAHRRGGHLTRAALDVGEALVKRLGSDGQCDPAQATIAADAGCCERTVRRAIGAMRDLGLLFWTMRLVRSGGWRAAQTSNAYLLLTTAAVPLPRPRCGGHRDRETRLKIQSTPSLSPPAQDAAARVNAARQLIALGFAVPGG